MSKRMKRFISLILTGALAAVCLAGCGGEKKQPEEADASKAMGRYLETDVTLPENTSMVYNMKQMEDGSIQIAAADNEEHTAVWKLSQDESSWEKVYDIDTEAMKEGKYTIPYVGGVAISPKGDSLVMVSLVNEEDETGADTIQKYFHLDASGVMKEVPDTPGDYAFYLQSGDDGNFYMTGSDFSIIRLDTETGQTEIIVDGAEKSFVFGTAGNTLYTMLKDGGVAPYDLEKGEPLPQDEGLNETFKQQGVNTSAFSTNTMPVLFTGGADEDTMFFCGNTGVFRHVKNGSVAEQVIDGSLNSLSNPDLGFVAMEVTEEEVIYVLAIGTEGNSLLKYAYSEDTPAVPEKELKVYSLYDNAEILQAISGYQKENPEISVKLEVGIAEESGITPSDALRTLSTEIMAGNGPDLMLLDGMPLDSYIEKGMLEDISDIISEVDQEEGLFSNITSAFDTDGKTYAVPLRFHMPVLEGQKESIDNVKDLASLVDEAERLHQENPDKPVINKYMDGSAMAIQLYDACSAAWVKDDGTIDEEKLVEFYTQIKRLCSVDDRSNNEGYSRGSSFAESVSSIGAGAMQMYADENSINFGSISTAFDLAQIVSTMAERENIGYGNLKGQTENSFLPSCIAGINSQGNEIESTRDFLKFLLGKSAQSMNQGNGMAVNKLGMEQMVMGNSLEGQTLSVGSSGDDDSFIEMTVRDTTEDEYQYYLEKVEELEIPALSNVIIREAVLEQANDCVTGAVAPEDAVKKVVEKINLYLAEG